MARMLTGNVGGKWMFSIWWVWVLFLSSFQDQMTVSIPANTLTCLPILATTFDALAATKVPDMLLSLQMWIFAELSQMIVTATVSSKSTRKVASTHLLMLTNGAVGSADASKSFLATRSPSNVIRLTLPNAINLKDEELKHLSRSWYTEKQEGQDCSVAVQIEPLAQYPMKPMSIRCRMQMPQTKLRKRSFLTQNFWTRGDLK